jgi:hypothetical protein
MWLQSFSGKVEDKDIDVILLSRHIEDIKSFNSILGLIMARGNGDEGSLDLFTKMQNYVVIFDNLRSKLVGGERLQSKDYKQYHSSYERLQKLSKKIEQIQRKNKGIDTQTYSNFYKDI